MSQATELLSEWRLVLLVLVALGFAPGAVLRIVVLAYPRSHPRRRELIAELYTVRYIERPLFVVQQLETALFEGLPTRWRRRTTESAPLVESVGSPDSRGNPFTDWPVVIMDTSAHGVEAMEKTQGRGFVNHLECEWIAAACRLIDCELRRRGGKPATVSVLTYYASQAEIIRARLGDVTHRLPMLRFEVVGTIDQIQGLQSDFVIVSFCRARRCKISTTFAGFLQDPRRFRIALTRARRTIILVGHAPTLRQLGGGPSHSEFAQRFVHLLERDDVTIVRDFKFRPD